MADAHRYNAACGWLELGNRAEAHAELAEISVAGRSHPLVLELRWSLSVAARDWNEAFSVAQELRMVLPDNPTGWLHSAYALRRMTGGGVKQAQELLLPAAEQFPREPVIAFNLACYACQLQQLESARQWFKRACEVGDENEIRLMALADDDLELLWPEIKEP